MNITALLLAAGLALTPAHPGPTGGTAHPSGRSDAHAAAPQDPLRVVATLPAYAEVARDIGGDYVDVVSIADPAEDAHFVRPKPSFALQIRRADVFITTGLDLELWVPALLDKAGNADVMEGGRGYVTTYTGVHLLDVPSATNRSEGDIHIYGNPHIFTDPLNMITVARNIATGLKRRAPEHAAEFDAGVAAFADSIYRHLYGDRLVDLLDGPTLAGIDRQGNLIDFLQSQQYQGRPLMDLLGGWHRAALPFRGQQVICYHKNWAYFQDRFDVTCTEYVEAKPGIPPTPGHVGHLVELMRDQGINVLFAANYFAGSQVRAVARRAGATAVIVPLQPGGAGTESYFDVVDEWVNSLAAAFQGS